MYESLLTSFSAAMGDSPGWRVWPFNSLGYEGGFWPIVAKFVFIAAMLGGIVLFLRFLFGPGGWLREEGWETMQEAKAREAAEKEAAEAKGSATPETKAAGPDAS